MRQFLFGCIHHLVTRYARLVVILSFLTAALAGFYGVGNMEMITDQDRLLSEDLHYHARYMEMLRQFGDQEFLYVVIEGNDKQEMIHFADALAARLRRSPDVQKVLYDFDTAWVKDYAILYASSSELRELHDELTAHRDSIHDLYATASIDDILRTLSDSLTNPEQHVAEDSRERNEELEALINALEGKPSTAFARFAELENRIKAQEETQYIWSDQGNFLLMFVLPAKDFTTLSVIEKPLERIRQDIWLTQQEFPHIKTGLTGRPALQADEMSTTNNDMLRASVIALIGVTLLFTLFFRELIRPLLAVLALLTAMGWTYGFVAFTLGHLNLLSLVFALVLIGLGIDFGIHFLHRYQEELEKSGNAHTAIHAALFHIGGGIITGAFTSSVAFLLALFTEFKGLAELGYVAGAGILFCLLAMLVTLPALLVSYDHHFRKGVAISPPFHLLGLRHGSKHPLLLLLVIATLTILFLPHVQEVRFDDNLLALQADGLESVQYEKKLIHESEHSTWYAVFLPKTLEENRAIVDRLNACQTVAAVDSIIDVLPDLTPEKHQILESLKEKLQHINPQQKVDYYPNPTTALHLKQQLNDLFYSMMQTQNPQRQNQSLSTEESDFFNHLKTLSTLLIGSREEITERLALANTLLLEQPRQRIDQVRQLVFQDEPRIDQLPDMFQTMYVGKDRSLMVMAYPKENIWEPEPMQRFVHEMRGIDPAVTGTPIQVYESSLLMRRAFAQIALFSFAVVAVLVFLDFLSLSALLFILCPLALGVLWLAELMGGFGIHLNLANFFAIPILIGIGVDDAVHFFHRYKEDHDVERAMYTTGTTLTLTTLTTCIGFGSLIFAAHKGLQSLGLLMAMGTATYWFSCVIFLPALIKMINRK